MNGPRRYVSREVAIAVAVESWMAVGKEATTMA